jgi:hypothetical protein
VESECEKLRQITVTPCYWGHLGSDLHTGGASVPGLMDTTKGLGDPNPATVSEEEYRVALWRLLFEDPLYELRVLALRQDSPRGWTPGPIAPWAFSSRSSESSSPLWGELASLLADGGIRQGIRRGAWVGDELGILPLALEAAPAALAEYRAAIARALMAEAVARVMLQARRVATAGRPRRAACATPPNMS